MFVLGAGLAGLSAARHLGGCEVFEKESSAGGHSRTKRVMGFNFDEGAHVFFGKGACADEFVWKPLANELIHHRAEIWNNYGGKTYGRYPVQVNAHALPPELATRCVAGFVEALRSEPEPPRTYKDWCYAAFGRAFSDEFMLRYARKVWTVEPEELNTEWLGSSVGGRIARPTLEQVLRGAIDPVPQELNYLTTFAYPSSGGFGRLAGPVSDGLTSIRLGCGVSRIDTQDRRIVLADSTERLYSAAACTLPLPTLVQLCVDAPPEVRDAAQRLMWTSLRCVNFGVARSNVGRGDWMYFYDHDVPFFRVSFPSRFAPDNAPPGHSSISCEISYSRRKPLDEERLRDRVVEELVKADVLESPADIVVQDEIDIPFAYVVYDFQRTEAVETIHTWMRSVELHPCGRFGEWGYHWSFEALESGRRVAAAIRDTHPGSA